MANKQQQYVHSACPECGGELQFQDGKKKLACRNCKYNRLLSNNYGTQVQKIGLKDRVNLSKFERGLMDHIQEFQCQKCKANLVLKNDQKLSQCPFCTSNDLKNANRRNRVFIPFEIIPPTIPPKLAQRTFKKYLKAGFFTFLPPEIRQAAEPESIKGVYLPGFLFDAYTRNSWKGEIGIKYNKPNPSSGGGNSGGGGGRSRNRSRSGGGSNQGGGQQGVSWDMSEGYFEKLYENILITASGAGDKGNVSALPFDPAGAVPFDPYYLGEWISELYQIDEIKAFDDAENIINSDLKRRAEYNIRTAKQHEYRKLEITSEKTCLTFRYVWLPVYLSSFVYQGKTFQYMVNAQTGRIAGKRPLSLKRIIIFFSSVILFLLLLAILVSKL